MPAEDIVAIALAVIFGPLVAWQGFRWGKHAALTMCRHIEQDDEE